MQAFRRWFGTTPLPSKSSPLETAFLQQSKALADTQKNLLKIISQQQETLDRIVTAKYDRPVFKAQEIDNPQMPLWGMNDQDMGYIPSPSLVEKGLASIENDSDREFIENLSK